MGVAPRGQMSAAEFIARATAGPGRDRHELVHGDVVAIAPERSGHGLAKARVWHALDDALRAAGVACQSYPDGMAIEIGERTVYEPDALVRCGDPLGDDAVKIPDPIIVVEVLSPSSEGRDAGARLADCARVPSVRHHLIVDPRSRVVIDHRIEGEAAVRTANFRSGTPALEPPGIAIVEFPDAEHCAACSLILGAGGGAERLRTTVLMTMEEGWRAMRRAHDAETGYVPPAGYASYG